MCGLVAFQGNGINRENFQQNIKNLSHRGPDDSGAFWNSGKGVALGHRRLSIIDLDSGCQPMTRSGVTTVYNGEVYNYRELKKALKKKGYTFQTESDTEVLIQSYREWGRECVKKFRGMFSFVIWDEGQQRLFLARDRLGQKPLFYTIKDDKFAVASEIQGLLEFPWIKRKASIDALSLYLGLQYIPSPHSGFQDIKKVKPGHYVVVEETEVVENKRYWEPDYATKTDLSYEEAQTQVRETLREAVRLRLRSDVDLGAFLSGGIDSSITVALMSEMSKSPVKTFSIGFDYEQYNELDYARQIAERFDTDHHEFTVTANVEELLDDLVEHYGEPFADSSAVPTYYVSRETSEHVKVALTGDGGDEAFGGYNRYRGMMLHDFLQHYIPGFVLRSIKWGAQVAPVASEEKAFINKLKRFTRKFSDSLSARNFAFVSYFNEDEIQKIMPHRDTRQNLPVEYMTEEFKRWKSVSTAQEKTMAVDGMTYLPEDLLVKVDIASMMNSLECRSPFLDHKVWEFAASLPVDYKIKWGMKKRILKDAFSDCLPENIINRPKQGFGIPRSEWFRDELKNYVRDLLLSPNDSFFSLIDQSYLEEMIDDHQNRKLDHGPNLWALMMFRLWWEKFDIRLP